jgi:all-trans-retinol dehydrogenase (NAD+)
MTDKYKDKVVLVTGGARGLGRLIALDFAKEGAKVAICDIRDEDLKKTAEDIEALGVDALSLNVDLSKKEGCYKVIEETEKTLGDINILVNNAGVVWNKDIVDTDDDLIEMTINVNLMAQVWGTKAVLRKMIDRDEGVIISVASGAGKVGLPAMGIYCSSKFGLIGFFDSLRHELRMSGSAVKVIVLNPGYMDTKMFVGAKIPRFTKMISPQEVSTALMKGIDKGTEEIFMPKMLRGIAFSRGLYPPWLMEKTIEFTGMHESFYTSKTID